MEKDIINDYQQQSQLAQHEADKYERLANNYSLRRLLIFAFLLLAVYISVSNDNSWILIICFIISVFAFSWLVSKQNKYDELKKYHADLKKVIDNEIESVLKHTNIYYSGEAFINEKHFYTADLDIFGKGSLFHFINRSATSSGNYKLASWLNKAADKQTILTRQDAVKELAAKPAWKQNFQTRLLFGLKQPDNQVKNLITYLKTTIEVKDEKFLWAYSYAAPFILLTLIILSFFSPVARYLAGVMVLGNYRLASSKSTTVKMTDMITGKIGEALFQYSLAFECVESEQWKTNYTKDLSLKIKTESRSVSGKIKELSKLINKLNYRLNMVVGFLMNIFFIWDVRQVIAIEKWKQDNHESLETAFDVIAEFEALISLSSLAINYPKWVFPQIADGDSYTITAKNIAHPLISNKFSVTNNYELTDAFKIDIITGSNMAGKSTFLRTIGINTILALAGAPVCADAMVVSVITIVSYMRIKDSLNESTSTFKAELDRLQMLLAAVENEPKVFFLIDEMLRGTNSVDKYLGSKAVIEQLIRKKGVGMVATHDLQIAELEKKYPDYIRNFYFDIQVVDGEMLFDYKMKHGECKTFNASLLLKQIGIDVDAVN
jgi:DNA mismatch repair ATPase MutS